jgi:hypothetical protein
MTRIEISNQHFYNDPKIKICQKECIIERDAVPLEVPSERVWRTFCNEVDQALQPVNIAKQFSRKSLLPCAILILILVLLTVGPALVDYDFVYRKYICYSLVGLLLIFQLYAYCRARSLCRAAFDGVIQVCDRHSDQGIRYRLGAVNKRFLRLKTAFVHKQYYVSVDSGDDDLEVGRSIAYTVFPIAVESGISQHTRPSPPSAPPLSTVQDISPFFVDVSVPWHSEIAEHEENKDTSRKIRTHNCTQ